MIEGEDYYFNDADLMVMTEKYLRARGFCCKSGCTHCPYGFPRLETRTTLSPSAPEEIST